MKQTGVVLIKCEKTYSIDGNFNARGRFSDYSAPCGQRSLFSKWKFIQEYYYVAPYSCTGGDYWLPGESKLVCPKCGHVNRVDYHSKKDDLLKIDTSEFAEYSKQYRRTNG